MPFPATAMKTLTSVFLVTIALGSLSSCERNETPEAAQAFAPAEAREVAAPAPPLLELPSCQEDGAPRPVRRFFDSEQLGRISIGSSTEGVSFERSASFRLRCAHAGCRRHCSLNGAEFEPCETTVRFEDLADGIHRLTVRFSADGDTEEQLSYRWCVLPEEVIPHHWRQVARGYDGEAPECAIDAWGGLWCWGSHFTRPASGLYDPPYLARPTPVFDDSFQLTRNWTQVVTSKSGICALREDGSLWCSRAHPGGDALTDLQLDRMGAGDGDEDAWNDWTKIGLRSFQGGCGLRTDGSIWCWNASGDLRQLPDESGEGAWSDWVALDLGRDAGCGLRQDGSAWCWGEDRNANGMLGPGGPMFTLRPMRILADDGQHAWSDWRSISIGRSMACGIRGEGQLWCWGNMDRSHTSAPAGIRSPLPRRVADAGGSGYWSDWTSVKVGESMSNACAQRIDGSLWCLSLDGENPLRQVLSDSGEPVADWVDYAPALNAMTAVRQDGSMWQVPLRFARSSESHRAAPYPPSGNETD